MAEKLYRGKVPKSVYDKELKAYLQRRKNSNGKKVKAQFKYPNDDTGLKYSFHKSGNKWQLIESAVKNGTNNKRLKNTHYPKLSSIEQKMVDNLYEDGSRLGLDVDHKRGRFHHPSNLGLLDPKVNSAKGDRLGGNYNYQPLITDDLDPRLKAAGITAKRAKALSLAVGGVLALGMFGTVASAAEVKVRNDIAQETENPLDHIQTGIAGVSLAADLSTYSDVAAIPGTIASTAADLVNGGIDVGRNFARLVAAGIKPN